MTEQASSTSTQVGEYYDSMAEFYDRVFGGNIHFGYWPDPESGGSFEDAADRLTDLVVSGLQVTAGQRVLDVGCGTGGPAVRLATATGAHVVGVTISREQVQRATARAAEAGLSETVTFLHADAMDLPFDHGSFDAAYALESIMHMPDRAHVFGSVTRLLRPGGRLALTDGFLTGAASGSAASGFMKQFHINPLPALDAYRDLARDAGVEVEELADISEQTRRQTYRRLIETAQKQRDMFENDLGVDVDGFVALFSRLADAVDVGYLLLRVRRPA